MEVEGQSNQEPPYLTDLDELNENLSHSYFPSLQPPKSFCNEMNLGTKDNPKNISFFRVKPK